MENSTKLEQLAGIEKLIRLITASDEDAIAQISLFHEEMRTFYIEEDWEDGWDLLETLKGFIAWKSGFWVDWKDTDSMAHSVNTLCKKWGVSPVWNIPKKSDDWHFWVGKTVPDLIEEAHAALQPLGLTLWQWDTLSDFYSGWICRSVDDGEILRISSLLKVGMWPGNDCEGSFDCRMQH